jgi:hypothetical protein
MTDKIEYYSVNYGGGPPYGRGRVTSAELRHAVRAFQGTAPRDPLGARSAVHGDGLADLRKAAAARRAGTVPARGTT